MGGDAAPEEYYCWGGNQPPPAPGEVSRQPPAWRNPANHRDGVQVLALTRSLTLTPTLTLTRTRTPTPTLTLTLPR